MRLALDERHEGARRLERRPLSKRAGVGSGRYFERLFDRFHCVMLHRGPIFGGNGFKWQPFLGRIPP